MGRPRHPDAPECPETGYACSTAYSHWKCRCPACKRYKKGEQLWRIYGITIEDYDRMWQEQDGNCWVCHQPEGDKGLGVDHNHDTKRVRHLLCDYCNRLEGLMKALIERGGREAARRFLQEYASEWT